MVNTKKLGLIFQTVVLFYSTYPYMWCFAGFVPFLKFKKREKHPWKSDTFSKVAGFNLKLY